MKRICIVTAAPETINTFFKDHIKLLSKLYCVTVITSNNINITPNIPKNVQLIYLNIKRNINLYRDLSALITLIKIFKKEKFDLVLSITSKVGLLSSLATYFSTAENRLHWFTGQIWATKNGLSRFFFKYIDKFIAYNVNFALVDSQSQLKFLISEKVLKNNKGSILGKGSICGVDQKKFKFNHNFKLSIKNKLGLHKNDKVILFLGRLNREKGIFDLIQAFHLIVNETKKVHLVLVGPDEENVEMNLSLSNQLHPNIHFVGRTFEPERWLCIGDIFCLPSYREGFGISVIEAAAIGLPAVTSRVYGLTDAVVENETGLMHEAGNVCEIAIVIKRILNDNKLRNRLSKNASERAKLYFNHMYISKLLVNYIRNIFYKKNKIAK